MGRTYAKVKVRNESDLANKRRGLTDTIREMEIEFFIDTDASKLYLPTAYIEKLGLTHRRDALVRTGGGDVKRRVFDNVEITVGERITTAEVIEIPNDANSPPILGRLILNGLDLRVAPKNGRLVPTPETQDLYVIFM